MAKESGRGRRNNRRQVNRTPASTKKQPLKPQQSAPARTSSLKTKKEANSDSSPVKSSGLGEKKVKPDTISAHKNPTR